MSLPGKDDYIKYRLGRAHETYGVAKLLVDNEAWNSAVNCLYYADLFDWRQKGDFGDFFDFKAADVLSVLDPTFSLIREIERLICSDEEE